MLKLVQMLTAQLLFHKPKDPRAFLLDLLTKIKAQGAKHLLTKQDVETMFGMFDITNQGTLSKQQAYQAVKTVLGPDHRVVRANAADCADAKATLTKAQFVEYVTGALWSAAAQPAA
jgi:DNA-binding phage protein